ncbi:NAD-dependent epimerase/dehydratase family protein [Shimia abyssi]|uniref:UDP-glucose 4-epimerase n=1 Tax=Shimia abyssi TaxID=1662395 RepID=A0A2P8F766_9RHOB|nr:NAD-dependent epimerase/dehydratase family protein [Shimia abyssi]PSL17561.1 UDP-glucose 4-epimerase [Shimia abyssi]
MIQLVLIGGLGFIGRNILNVVASDKSFSELQPVVIDNLSNSAPRHEAVPVPACYRGFETPDALEFLEHWQSDSDTPRVHIFLAGETRVAESLDRPMDFVDANITQPSQFVLKAVQPGDHFILISTAGALFDGATEIQNTLNYSPKNFYGATKAAEEMVLEKLVRMRGGSFSIVRMTNVYGKFSDNKKSAIHAFMRACLSGDEVVINGDGLQRRDFVYAGDVARAIALHAYQVARKQCFEKVNTIGSGKSVSLMDIVSGIEQVSSSTLYYNKVPAPDLLKTEPREVVVNPNDARRLLDGDFTPLNEGLRSTLDYYSATPQGK